MTELNNFKLDVIYALNNSNLYSSYVYKTIYQKSNILHSTENFYPISFYNTSYRFYKYAEINKKLKSQLLIRVNSFKEDFYCVLNRYSGGKVFWGNFSAFLYNFQQYALTPLVMLCFRPNKRIYRDKEFYEKDFKFFINFEIFDNPDYKKIVTYYQKIIIPLCKLHNIEIIMGDTKLFEKMFIHTISEDNIQEPEIVTEVLNELLE